MILSVTSDAPNPFASAVRIAAVRIAPVSLTGCEDRVCEDRLMRPRPRTSDCSPWPGFCPIVLGIWLFLSPFAAFPQAQTQAAAAGAAATAELPPPPKTQTIDTYIHQGWDTLSRSSSECTPLVGPKVTTEPVLYLPADVPTPPEITRMQSQCKVSVQRLPHAITRFGQMRSSEIRQTGLLYLPNRYVVP